MPSRRSRLLGSQARLESRAKEQGSSAEERSPAWMLAIAAGARDEGETSMMKRI